MNLVTPCIYWYKNSTYVCTLFIDQNQMFLHRLHWNFDTTLHLNKRVLSQSNFSSVIIQARISMFKTNVFSLITFEILKKHCSQIQMRFYGTIFHRSWPQINLSTVKKYFFTYWFQILTQRCILIQEGSWSQFLTDYDRSN